MKPFGAFAQFAALMLEGDYSPVPIKVGEKRPLFEKWDRLRSAALTPAEIEELCRNYQGLGLGVAGGFGGLVPIDVDTDDRDIVRAIRGALPPVEVAKRGQKGFTAFYWDPAGVIGGMKFRHPRIDGGWDMLLELLATGQSVLPPTPHPAIKRAFRWLTTATLFNTRVDELPIIGKAHIAAVKEALFPWLPRPVLCPPLRKPQAPTRPAAGNRMDANARAAFAGEVQILSGLPCGRNTALFHAACRLGKYVHHGILPEAEVQVALMAATHANGYASAPHGGAKKALATIKSGFNKAKGDPLPDLDAKNRNKNMSLKHVRS